LSNDSTPSAEQQPAPLSKTSSLRRLLGIGVVLLSLIAAFLCLGGWFSPNALTPSRFTDAFEQNGGLHPGFRRNHAKGVAVTGYFESNGAGARLSKSLVFQPGRVSVLGRFSFGGGDPNFADTPTAVRGLGILFWLPNGEEWRTAMINLPVFPFQTPRDFYDNLVASKPNPKTGKPDPQKMTAFAANHPATIKALGIIQSHAPSSGFANTTFNSLNAFRFIDAAGNSLPVRWTLVPVQPSAAGSPPSTPQPDKNRMFDDLIASVLQHPLQWHLIITVGQPGDPTNDATLAWPDGREHMDVGTLTLDHIESEETNLARDINFDPLVLPSGMAPSDDPLLSARSAIYSKSFTRRAGETKTSSAISPAEVRK
jgi:catalase